MLSLIVICIFALAAYVIALPDGRSYRVFDGHFDSSFGRYSPGRLLEATVLDRALADGRYSCLDWGSGIASEKLLAFNASEPRTRLQARSRRIPAPRTADDAPAVERLGSGQPAPAILDQASS